MPFIAVDQNDPSVRYAIRTMEAPKAELTGKLLMCQACHYPMYIRGGSDGIQFHFAHFPNYPASCPYALHERWGGRHEMAKAAVGAYLRRFDQYAESAIEDEIHIPSVNRIVDVLVRHTNGEWEAHEVQLSVIPYSDILERTLDYNAAGIEQVVWWLGNPMLESVSVPLVRDALREAQKDTCITRVEYADWPILLHKRHLWPDELMYLEDLGRAYRWPVIPLVETGLNSGKTRYREIDLSDDRPLHFF